MTIFIFNFGLDKASTVDWMMSHYIPDIALRVFSRPQVNLFELLELFFVVVNGALLTVTIARPLSVEKSYVQ